MLLDRTRKLKMSFISFLGKAIVYIGESETSLYDRCYTHENPHTDKSWFADADEVRIIVLDSNMNPIARQSLEAMFILAYRPKKTSKAKKILWKSRGSFLALRVVGPDQTKKRSVFSGRIFSTFPFVFSPRNESRLLSPVLTHMAEYFRRSAHFLAVNIMGYDNKGQIKAIIDTN